MLEALLAYHCAPAFAGIKTANLAERWFSARNRSFLGYPLRDIYAFINHRDEGCLLIEEWKVYHNAGEAEKLFRRFKA